MKQMIFPLDSDGMGLFEQCRLGCRLQGVMEYAASLVITYLVFIAFVCFCRIALSADSCYNDKLFCESTS